MFVMNPFRRLNSSLPSFFMALVLLTAGPARAQVSPATLSGDARDESGAALPGADITLTASVGGAVTRARANDQGRFEIRDITPGRYAVVAERQGFVPAVIPDLVLDPGASRSVILELRVPFISDVVSVVVENACSLA
jgi:hypothetical protein